MHQHEIIYQNGNLIRSTCCSIAWSAALRSLERFSDSGRGFFRFGRSHNLSSETESSTRADTNVMKPSQEPLKKSLKKPNQENH